MGSVMNSMEYIQAAGGLLWRESEIGKELLVIHRKRYDDWTLPKGKLERGETLKETAIREVKEETGYEVKITGFAGAIAYEVKGKTKVVSFWHMASLGEPAKEVDTEVAEVVWLPVQRAVVQLQYPLERVLVEAWLSIDEEEVT